ncbi:YCL021W-A-like protein [Saccharomyces kudriavzevii IFO 1802]|uniref:YCL021W-A-like protein n=1 Tax=Saccharomyces kudriavzevii (strain ATCC MYA-4449 / AS 2.2408 / CBS 8840 / NBRC 1802 / NCYC 2889) TaxID=226230 RepID=J6EFP2_SACK1|nr:YCL021W-A-like protein [Saccharomyces kudriavzevii IFO 1802]
MTLLDKEELCDSKVASDCTFFDLESNHSNDSVHLLLEKYTHELPIKDNSRTAFKLNATKQKMYKQNTLYVPLTFKERFFLFAKRIKKFWAKLSCCKPNKYAKVSFILVILIPLAVWMFYVDVHLR